MTVEHDIKEQSQQKTWCHYLPMMAYYDKMHLQEFHPRRCKLVLPYEKKNTTTLKEDTSSNRGVRG